MGMGFNYLFFLDRIPESSMKTWGWPLFLLNTGTVSIAVFLHTLRFKKKLKPRLAHGIYVVMAYMSFMSVPFLCMAMLREPTILLIVCLGIYVNMMRNKVLMNCHYCIASLAVFMMRFSEFERKIGGADKESLGNTSFIIA